MYSAIDYKNQEIPKKIYKYFSFGDETDVKQLYFIKLNTLLENKIFFSSIKNFNDPFEFETAYISDDIKGPGYDAAKLRELVNRAAIRIASFSTDGLNVPMWAYYSDSFKGYCVEYDVDNKDKFFPVKYLEDRISSYMSSSILHNNDEETYLKLAQIFSTKYIGWEHEKEIRAVVKRPDYLKGGMNAPCEVTCEELGIKPAKIVLGCKCSKRSKKDINSVVYTMNKTHNLNVVIKQMELKKDGFGFELKKIPIITPSEDDRKEFEKSLCNVMGIKEL